MFIHSLALHCFVLDSFSLDVVERYKSSRSILLTRNVIPVILGACVCWMCYKSSRSICCFILTKCNGCIAQELIAAARMKNPFIIAAARMMDSC